MTAYWVICSFVAVVVLALGFGQILIALDQIVRALWDLRQK